MDLMSTSLRSVDIKSIGHRFPLDINCGSPPNRRTTDTVRVLTITAIPAKTFSDISCLYCSLAAELNNIQTATMSGDEDFKSVDNL